MRLLIFLSVLFQGTFANAQVGSVASTCIWSGSLADCLPSTGILLRNQRVIRFSEATGGGTNYVALTAPAALAADRTATFPDATGEIVLDSAAQTLTNKTINGSNNTITNVSLTTGVTGVLPLANGGTNKNATAVNGGLVWSDADSFEITAAGTASQWVLSGGTATPTMSNTTTTAKFIDGSADAIQLTVQGNGTQTSDIFVAEKSDGTDLLEVTNTAGTAIRGTTTGATAASGFVGEIQTVILPVASKNALATGTAENMSASTLGLNAGQYQISGGVDFSGDTGTTYTQLNVSLSTVSGTMAAGVDLGIPNTSTGQIWIQRTESSQTISTSDVFLELPTYDVFVTSTTTLFIVIRATFAVNSLWVTGYVQARRVR